MLSFFIAHLSLVPPAHVEVAGLSHHRLRGRRRRRRRRLLLLLPAGLLLLLRQRREVPARRRRLQGGVGGDLPVRPLKDVV